jgi:hypothetical protein
MRRAGGGCTNGGGPVSGGGAPAPVAVREEGPAPHGEGSAAAVEGRRWTWSSTGVGVWIGEEGLAVDLVLRETENGGWRRTWRVTEWEWGSFCKP